MTLNELFPPLEPYASEYLSVGDGHELYVEQCGRQGGVPVMILHGGPGSGATPTMRRFFDPDYFRMIIFDQRGAGRSRPSGELGANTPDALVADIEKIRTHLGIDRWHVFGGSWGSTLALLYGETHPKKCMSLTLRGIFLMQHAEINFLYVNGHHVFAEEWEKFITHLPIAARANPVAAYYDLLTYPDPTVHRPAAAAWNRWEISCSYLIPNAEALSSSMDDAESVARARIECHYFHREIFTPDDRILRGVGALHGIPASIIHGRYDMVCPISTAFALHAAWPEAEFIIVPDSGHSANDPAMRSALVAAAQRLKTSGI